MSEHIAENNAADRRLFISDELIDMIENRPPVYKPHLAELMTGPSRFDAHERTVWIITELSVALTGPPVDGEPHSEATPIGPFASREEADEWASAHVGQFGSGSWSIAPLRPPTCVLPPEVNES